MPITELSSSPHDVLPGMGDSGTREEENLAIAILHAISSLVKLQVVYSIM
ncbi:MAG: hypothetical protein ACXV5F_08375 [Halobacteriota archaeon]